MKRGKIDLSFEEIVLNDGTVIKCLTDEDLYKFLGVPENEVHDVGNIVEKIKKVVKQRMNVIWTSPLSDFNKISATNIFVNSSMECFMWSEKFNIGDIRDIDISTRAVLNNVKAKYPLQMNSSLYVSRTNGGRGLKSLETTYKRTKVAAAMNLLTRDDPRMECVRQFERKRMEKGRSSCITDAIRFAEEDFDLKFEVLQNDFIVHYEKDGETKTTSDKKVVKNLMKRKVNETLLDEMYGSTWQGVIINIRKNDPDINFDECFAWLSKWKDAPVNVINDFQSIYLQTVPTLTFKKYRGGGNITSTVCRLCLQGQESVKHLLSNCTKFVAHAFKRRHDRVLQYIMFKYLHKMNMITDFPPWFSKISIKPHYETEELDVYWDIPEYSGYSDVTSEHGPLRPDGKIEQKDENDIRLRNVGTVDRKQKHQVRG